MPTNGKASDGCGFWWKPLSCEAPKYQVQNFCLTVDCCQHLQLDAAHGEMMKLQKALTSTRHSQPSEETMNSIIYIVGLVVIIGVILSYFGFR